MLLGPTLRHHFVVVRDDEMESRAWVAVAGTAIDRRLEVRSEA
jgi:hypothetical protein